MAGQDLELQIKVEGDLGDVQSKLKQLTKEVDKTSSSIEGMNKDLSSSFKASQKDIGSLLLTFGKLAIAFEAARRAAQYAFNAILQGEKILKLDQTFDNLTKRIGVASSALKDDFREAVGGLMSDAQIVEILNGSIVRLGDKVVQLPQIMELARRATDTFGGDLKSNFEAITVAIESGNTSRLKSISLNLDDAKAADTYATSLGKTAEQLSNAGRQQSTINALLLEGEKRFQGVQTSTSGVDDNLVKMRVAAENLNNAFTVFFNNRYAEGFAIIFNEIARGLRKVSGDSTLKDAEEDMTRAKTRLYELNQAYKELQADRYKGVHGSSRLAALGNQIKQQEIEVKRLTDEYNKMYDAAEGKKDGQPRTAPNKDAGSIDPSINPSIDPEKTKEAAAEVVKVVDETQKKIEEMQKAFASGLSNALIDFADGTKTAGEAFDQFARDFLRRIADMILQQAILNAISGFGVGSSTGGGGGRVAQSAFAFANGGLVTGPGTGTSDSINARLSNGEYVLRANAVKSLGVNFLDNLNRVDKGGFKVRRPANHYADGGLVESSAQAPQVVIENSGSEKQVSRTEYDPTSAVTTVFLEDAQKNGPISKALQSTFGVKRGGFR